MSTWRQGPDGNWYPAKFLPVQGKVARLEFWLRRKGFKRLAGILGAWDERGLGK